MPHKQPWLRELARSCNKTESTKGGLAHGFGGEQFSFRLPVSADGAPLGEVCLGGWGQFKVFRNLVI